jgi:hypothetical protein
MENKENDLRAAELSTEQNANMLDGILNNAPLLPLVPDGGRLPEVKPLDKVKDPPQKRRSREWER